MRLFYLIAGFDGVDAGTGSGEVNVPTLSAGGIFEGLLNGAYILTGIVCVVVIIVAGYRYITSQGDSGATAKAKNAILYAVIGLVLVAFAFVITQFISIGVTSGI